MSRVNKKSLVDQDVVIDLTSMTDCIFLLLIFFVVTTVFDKTSGLDVDVPPPNPAQEKTQPKNPLKDINVVINVKNQIEIKGKKVELNEIQDILLKEMKDPNCSKNVVFQADHETLHEWVVKILDEIKAVKPQGIIFAKEEDEKGES